MKEIPWEIMSKEAWKVRENSFTFGVTKVGATVISESGQIFNGCNVEHKFRSHDIHAEVNAISNMLSSGEKYLKGILIVADRDFFVPCGSCMDWIMQHGGEDCFVVFENKEGIRRKFLAKELMPFYPK